MPSDEINSLLNHKILPNEELIRLHKLKDYDTIVVHNLRMVWNIAFGYAKQNFVRIPAEDLFFVGIAGLIKAVHKWKPKIAKLSTYATWWIKQSIGREIDMFNNHIRPPCYLKNKPDQSLLSLIKQSQKSYHRI